MRAICAANCTRSEVWKRRVSGGPLVVGCELIKASPIPALTHSAACSWHHDLLRQTLQINRSVHGHRRHAHMHQRTHDGFYKLAQPIRQKLRHSFLFLNPWPEVSPAASPHHCPPAPLQGMADGLSLALARSGFNASKLIPFASLDAVSEWEQDHCVLPCSSGAWQPVSGVLHLVAATRFSG